MNLILENWVITGHTISEVKRNCRIEQVRGHYILEGQAAQFSKQIRLDTIKNTTTTQKLE